MNGPNDAGSVRNQPINTKRKQTNNTWKALLGLERVRSEVNISMLPRPPSYHRGVYVFGSDSGGGPEEDEIDGNGGGGGYFTGDPLPEAWVQIERYEAKGAETDDKRWNPYYERKTLAVLAFWPCSA